MVDEFKAIDLPILVVTSEFGTVLMWDWEICSYLRSEGINTIAPYSLEQTRKACRALGVKRELNSTKFLVFQDNPGVGMQSEIFKRFYWFEDECIQRMIDKFGIQLVKKSYKQFAGRAMSISDEKADDVIGEWLVNTGDITTRQLRSAVKIYIALSEELDNDPSIRAVGINCLNESRFSDTTPCLAWSMLYEERRLIWGCEADIMSMITKYLLHNSLGMPIMMTNLYPFLMGHAALAHERIPHFPEVETAPEDHILAAHCGYLGVLPTSFATEWALRKKVLAIVDDNATAIDGRLPEGPMTLAKIQPTLQSLMVMEGSIEGYVQYPDSDCLTGGVLRISDGYKLVNNVASHHYLLMTGHQLSDIQMLGQIFDLGIDIV
jgi:L-fucose isomerase-like protein